VWQYLEGHSLRQLAPDAYCNAWIEGNLKGRHRDLEWATKFLLTIWYIWKQRNAFYFIRIEEILEEKGRFLLGRFRDKLHALGLDNPFALAIETGRNETLIR